MFVSVPVVVRREVSAITKAATKRLRIKSKRGVRLFLAESGQELTHSCAALSTLVRRQSPVLARGEEEASMMDCLHHCMRL